MARTSLTWVGDVAVVVSIDPPTPASVALVGRELSARIAEVGRIGCVVVVRPDGPFVAPDEAGMRALQRLLDDTGAATVAALVVFERQGFAAAALRAMISGVLFFARAPMPLRIVARWQDGAAWFSSRLAAAGVAVAREALDRAIDGPAPARA